MKGFLIQTIGGEIVHDFNFTLLRAIEYEEWRTGEKIPVVRCEMEDMMPESDLIPSGTVEFVKNWIWMNLGEYEPVPLNVPPHLFEFAGRWIKNVRTKSEMEEFQGEVFIKSTEIVKSGYNCFTDWPTFSSDRIPEASYQISERVDIISEYRCFVWMDQLRGIQWYSGDFTRFPDVQTIEKIIKKEPWDFGHGKGLKAWSFDVGILKNGQTIIIEAHEIYSLGLYGFSDYQIYVYMLRSGWKDMVRRLENDKTVH